MPKRLTNQTNAPGGEVAEISWIRPGDPRIAAEQEQLLSALCRFGTTIPALVVEAKRELSDVCSPISRYVSYPLEEARRRARPWQLPLLHAGAGLIGAGLRRLGLQRAVYVNNWLLSTNPPLRLPRPQIATLTHWLVGEFSDHAIVYRSVYPALEPELTGSLLAAGCRLLTTRAAYVLDPRRSSFERRHNVRKDWHLLRTSPYQISHDKASLSEGELQRLTELYQQLYVGKHCHHNAQFNAASLFREPGSGRLQPVNGQRSLSHGLPDRLRPDPATEARPLPDGADAQGAAGPAHRVAGEPQQWRGPF